MINSILVTNFKGLSGHFNLSPLTLITGENGSGKTSLIQAITLALTGSLPDIGKTNAAQFKLSSGDFMRVLVDYKGAHIGRTLSQKGRSVSLDTTGDEFNTASGFILVNDFQNGSGKDRLRMIAEASPGADWKALVTLLKETAEYWKLQRTPDLEPLSQAAELVGKLKEVAKEARTRKQTYEKTLLGTTEFNAAHPGPAPKEVALKDVMEAINANHTATNAARAIEETIERIDHAKAMLATLPDTPAAEKLYEGIKELEQQHGAANQKIGNNSAEFRALIREGVAMDQTVEELTAERDLILTTNPKETEGKLWDAEANANSVADAIGKVEEELRIWKDDKKCPTCGAVTKPGKLAGGTAALEARLVELTESAAELREKIIPELKVQVAANDRWALIDRTLRAAELKKHGAAMQEGEEAIYRKIQELRNDVLFAKQRAEILSFLAVNDPEAANRALNDAQGKEMEAKDREERITEERAAWEAWEKLASDYRGAQSRKEEIQRAAIEQESRITTANAAAKQIELVADEQAAAVYGPVLLLLAKLTASVLSAPLVLNPVSGEIGYWRGHSFIGFPTMGGSEQLISVACLQVVLAQGSANRVVILDELNRQTPETKRRFLAALLGLLKAGEIEQVIIADHDAKAFTDGKPTKAKKDLKDAPKEQEWQVINMTGSRPEVAPAPVAEGGAE